MFPSPRCFAILARAQDSPRLLTVSVFISPFPAPFSLSGTFPVSAFISPTGSMGVRVGIVAFPFDGAWVGVVGMLGCYFGAESPP